MNHFTEYILNNYTKTQKQKNSKMNIPPAEFSLYKQIQELQIHGYYPADLKSIIKNFTAEELQAQHNFVQSSIFELCISNYHSIFLANFILCEYPDIDVNKHCYRQPLLHRVIKNGTRISIDLLEKLLDRGANVNSINHMGHTPLIEAIVQNNLNALKMLLMYGADPHFIEPDMAMTAYNFSKTMPEIREMFDEHINSKTKFAGRKF